MSTEDIHVVDILLIEDNEGDVLLTREAFRKGKIANNIHVCPDGEDGLKFLRREGKYGEAARPDLGRDRSVLVQGRQSSPE